MGSPPGDDLPHGLEFEEWYTRGDLPLAELRLTDWPRFLFLPEKDWEGLAFGRYFDLGDPLPAIQRSTQFFWDFAKFAAPYSHGQVDRGVWRFWSEPYWANFLDPVDDVTEIEFAQSFVAPFRDYLARVDESPFGNGFYMWFDLTEGRMNSKSFRVRDAYLATLVEILDLRDGACQLCALHGLGHLDHPERPKVVQDFIHRHGSEGWDLQWLLQCRDGTVM